MKNRRNHIGNHLKTHLGHKYVPGHFIHHHIQLWSSLLELVIGPGHRFRDRSNRAWDRSDGSSIIELGIDCIANYFTIILSLYPLMIVFWLTKN